MFIRRKLSFANRCCHLKRVDDSVVEAETGRRTLESSLGLGLGWVGESCTLELALGNVILEWDNRGSSSDGFLLLRRM
jgi:hypothetical protein